MKFNARELCERFGGTIAGDPGVQITGVGSLETASAGDITFAEKPHYRQRVETSSAAAFIVGEEFPAVSGKTLWRVAQPRQTFIRILNLFYLESQPPAGLHPTAAIAADASIGEDVTVSEHAAIRARAQIGRGTIIESGSHIGQGVVVGENCLIGPNVSLLHGVRLGARVRIHAGSVIGGDGFGYEWMDGRHCKVPSFGSVHIEDDVEIGCNVCIDRATFGATRIRRGAKIDNLVQIAHNNDIGEHAIIVSQVGLSGTVKVGAGATLAGQVGVADHVTIGEGATVAAASGVSKNVKSGEIVWGLPARPLQKAWRELASLARLPQMARRLKELESRCATIENLLKGRSKH
jgi:UDP-3-O-[3-hydroxymyristoyl] glucosamine N-acyltransferase